MPKAIVRLQPGPDFRVCVVATLIRNVERDGSHGPDVGTQLEQRPVLLECPGQVGRLIGRSEPAPRDEIGVRRDRSRRVDLKQGQVVDKVDQCGWPSGVEKLGSHRDLPRFFAADLYYAHTSAHCQKVVTSDTPHRRVACSS